MVSIGPYDLCLSPHVAKGWRQKEIKPFALEMTESACIIIIIINDIITVYNTYSNWNIIKLSMNTNCILLELSCKLDRKLFNSLRF